MYVSKGNHDNKEEANIFVPPNQDTLEYQEQNQNQQPQFKICILKGHESKKGNRSKRYKHLLVVLKKVWAVGQLCNYQ